MNKSAPTCPVCNTVITFFGEGGYGRFKNDCCRFEMKTAGCQIPGCDDYNLDHRDIEHDPEG